MAFFSLAAEDFSHLPLGVVYFRRECRVPIGSSEALLGNAASPRC